MGSPISQIQAPQTSQPQSPQFGQSQGKIGQVIQATRQAMPPQGQSDGVFRPAGKGGQVTYSGQSGQPQYGQPNRYSNTVGPWDNATIQQPVYQSGKGKGR